MSFKQHIKARIFTLPYLFYKKIKMNKGLAKNSKVSTLYNKLTESQKKMWIYRHVKTIACYAYDNNAFYRGHYKFCNFNPHKLNSFTDLNFIPIINKAILKQNMDQWLQPGKHSSIGNTGGTTGEPLQFCISKSQSNREVFYMTSIWKKFGFKHLNHRAVFRGIHIGNLAWKYDPYANAFFVNQFLSMGEITPQIIQLFKHEKIQHLHGYPSAIYIFAKHCLANGPELLELVNSNLKSILLGSEFPAPVYRKIIEEAFPVPNVSWYGHSEMVVLAAESTMQFLYQPFHSYGFCEGIKMQDGLVHLVGTSYDNRESPFIRYDTEDSILPKYSSGLLKEFHVDKGRIGEFIFDKKNNRISLTALIFGRHHEVFNVCTFLQISQNKNGTATLHITSNKKLEQSTLPGLFNFSAVDIDFNYVQRDHPFVSISGKVPLLIRN